ncbi:MAG: GerAB/ArcD/ProY family transporter [Eubacterium sp.]|nr:GerAB/ArcD/ProY family transporter [Eubacterium sp.]
MESPTFSSNGKVSIRQMSRMMFLELFGLGTLILPGPLAKICQTDGIFAILIAAAIWSGIVLWLCRKPCRESVDHNGKQGTSSMKFGRQLSAKIKATIQILVFALAAGFLFYLLVSLVERQLLDSNYLWIIVASILFAGGYGIMKGIESRARIYEILFWILLIPLAIILVIAMWNIHPDYWLPVFAIRPAWFLLGIAVCMAAFLPAVLCVLLRPSCAEPDQVGSVGAQMVWWAGVGCALVYLILLGIFQSDLLAVLKYPIISLMSVVQMPGNLMERLDAPMVTIWFFCLFALFHSLCYYCVEGIQKLFPMGKKIGRKVWIGMILILLSSLLLLLHGCGKKGPESAMYPLAIGIEENKDTRQMVVSYAIPASVAGGVGNTSSGEASDGAGDTGKGTSGSDSGNAGSGDSFRTVLAESLFAAEEKLAVESEKTLDLNHMKVFIISREMLLDKDQKEVLFSYFLENENMAWNTCLLFTEENVEDLFQDGVTGDTSMGFYVEELLKSREDKKEKSVFTVKDFMSLYQNKTETMLAPIVSLQNGQLAIAEYCVISRCGDRGTLSAQDAAYVNMLLNKQKTVSLVLEDDEYATLQDIRVERRIYEDESGNPKQEILVRGNLKLSADWLFDRSEKKQVLEEATAKVEARLNELVNFCKEENHADLTNSYLALSGYDRKLWKLYRDNPDAYEKKLKTTVEVKLKMLDT